VLQTKIANSFKPNYPLLLHSGQTGLSTNSEAMGWTFNVIRGNLFLFALNTTTNLPDVRNIFDATADETTSGLLQLNRE
jgi:hypothetical protein